MRWWESGIEWMIDHAAWLTPVMVLGAGAPLTILVVRRARSSLEARKLRRQRREQLRARLASEPGPEPSSEPLGPVFESEPRCVDVATQGGAVRVVHAAIGNAPLRDSDSLQQMMDAIMRACTEHGTARVLLEMVESWPSSRRFWHALRYLARECAGVGGLLVVRVEGGEPCGIERGPFYVRMDGSQSVDAGLREAAEGVRLDVPELDEL